MAPNFRLPTFYFHYISLFFIVCTQTNACTDKIGCVMFSKLKLLAVLSCVLAVGCTKVNSIDIPSDKLIITVKVQETEGDAAPGILVSGMVSKSLEEGDDKITIVELSGGETLVVDAFSETRILQKTSVAHPVPLISNAILYQTTFPYTADASVVTVRLNRASGEVFEETIGLPSTFQLLSPSSEAVFSVSNDDIQFVWDTISVGTGINTELDFRIANDADSCLETFIKEDLEDTGSYLVPAGTLALSEGVDQCVIKVTVLAEDRVTFEYNEDSSLTALRPLVTYSLTLTP